MLWTVSPGSARPVPPPGVLPKRADQEFFITVVGLVGVCYGARIGARQGQALCVRVCNSLYVTESIHALPSLLDSGVLG